MDPQEGERIRNARDGLRVLEEMSKLLATVHGRRKAIVYFGEGIDYDVYGGAAGADSMYGNAPGRDTVRDSMRRAVRAATRANVVLYAIDPRGLSRFAEDTSETFLVPPSGVLRL